MLLQSSDGVTSYRVLFLGRESELNVYRHSRSCSMLYAYMLFFFFFSAVKSEQHVKTIFGKKFLKTVWSLRNFVPKIGE